MPNIPHYQPQNCTISIDKIQYKFVTTESPLDIPHRFYYSITIYNNSDHSLKLLGTQWIFRQVSGQISIIETEKLAGATPCVQQGELFSYISFHSIDQDTEAHGHIYGIDELGRHITSNIPHFAMILPKNGIVFSNNIDLGEN